MYIDSTTRELLDNDAAVSDAKEYLSKYYEHYNLRYDPDRAAVSARGKAARNLWNAGMRTWGMVEWQGLVNTVSELLNQSADIQKALAEQE